MKRADNLFEQITDLENLKLAYLKALKGKRYTPAALIYGNKVDENLFSLKVCNICFLHINIMLTNKFKKI